MVASNNLSATCCICELIEPSYCSGYKYAHITVDTRYVLGFVAKETSRLAVWCLILAAGLYVLLVPVSAWRDRLDALKVYFIASGSDDETEVRRLEDRHRPILYSGARDVFVMAVPRCLGQLNYLRIWHDNSGPGTQASWYLRSVRFRDLQTGEIFHFTAESWLALDEADGKIDRLLRRGDPGPSKKAPSSSTSPWKDRHIWLSVLTRPPRSRFTRLQRLTVCLTELHLLVLVTALWYRHPGARLSGLDSARPLLHLGPVTLHLEQVCLPLLLYCMSIRKYSTVQVAIWRLVVMRFVDIPDDDIEEDEESAVPVPDGDWFVTEYICENRFEILSTLFSLWRILPILRLLCGSCDSEEIYCGTERAEAKSTTPPAGPEVLYRPLDDDILSSVRAERERQSRLRAILGEVVSYAAFLLILLMMSNGSRDPSAFILRRSLIRHFIRPGDPWNDFNKVSNERKFWNWTFNVLLPELLINDWYNGRAPLGLRGFVEDRANLKIGYAVMRQVRIRPRECTAFLGHS
ncbi:hypothetical protein LAZ67_4003027 [Cordylochernes scorpioides]|uniref:PLAT domain-containing protein n=1 Tax=Cordylochernes scorpioides TaxID=51811 RepID=A0ABY6KEB4_9ARAC|nr:hypothetical protein LAZ67_4003027 [Cordylochernes scorpioides]